MKKEKVSDKNDLRHPELERIGCLFGSSKECGFQFFNCKFSPDNNSVFIFNQGILWKVKK